MTSLLTLALLATVSASAPSHSFVKDEVVHVRFYDLTKIYGPLKFYVSANGYPAASCADCPTGTAASYVVPPEMVYQTWPQGGKYLEVTFPCSCVGDMHDFYFTAVTCLATEEKYLGSGLVPNAPARGKGSR